MAFVHEGHYLGSSHIAFGKLVDAKSIALDDGCNSAIEMAAAGQVLPRRCQTILPPAYLRFRSEAVFHEQELAVRLQYPTHFSKCLIEIRNAAHRPRRHDRIDTGVFNWNSLDMAIAYRDPRELAAFHRKILEYPRMSIA